MNRYIIGSLWDRVNRNGANKNFEYLFEGSKRVDELNQRADTILSKSDLTLNEAKKTNDMNKDVQKQVDDLILHAGESDAEVIQARGGLPLLKDRLDETDSQLAKSVQLQFQPDYVDFIRSHSKSNKKIKVKRTSARNFELGIPLSNGKYQKHTFDKDSNDDFIKHSIIGIGEYGNQEVITTKSNYDAIEGSGWSTTGPLNYATVVGSSFTFAFNGTGLDFYTTLEARGGIWEFVIDGGTPIQLSTHSNATNDAVHVVSTVYKKQVVRGLVSGEHTVVATFMGEDPNNPSATPRGWVYYNIGTQDHYTFDVIDEKNHLSHDIQLSPKGSNKEFAIGMKKEGATYGAGFVPDHGSPTALPIEQFLYYDNSSKSITGKDENYVEVDNVKLVQKIRAVNPNEPSLDLAHIYVIHTANSDGLHCKVKIDFLVDTWLSGYVCMFPSTLDFANELIVSTNDSYQATKNDDTITNIPNGDKAKSFAFINTNGTQNQRNTVYAMTVDNISRTFRQDEEGTREPTTLWLQHRSTMQKLYPQVLDGYTAQAGETLEAGYTMYAGQVEYASMLIK